MKSEKINSRGGEDGERNEKKNPTTVKYLLI